MRRAIRVVVAAAALSALAAFAFAAEKPADPAAGPGFVGSGTCAACHADAAEAWRGSHHDLAWTLPGEGAVLGDFDDAELAHDGIVTRFRTDAEGRPLMTTPGPDGVIRDYEVKGVAGIAPLQQYLIETEPGRLQTPDMTWDAVRNRWYDLYPAEDHAPGEGLHWTGPYKTWNARCAECHATDYSRAYDASAGVYRSREAEIGVGCEACHGPGEAHVSWAEAGAEPGAGLTPLGFLVAYAADAPETEIQTCATCHSRREPLLDRTPPPGTPFHEAYRLSLLRPGLYHADGQILEEVYVYGSFLQSRMHQQGVRCTDCHDPHAAEPIAEVNAVCTQCHSPAGNPRFPTLIPADYDAPEHHFHEEGTAGAECRSCHMIERTYMQIDGRRDHSFRVPRPDLAGVTGGPDACTDCHADRDPAWAAAEIAARHPEGRVATSRPHYGPVLAMGRRDPAGERADLIALASDLDWPGIVRASALDLAAQAPDPALAAAARPLLADPDPMVREAALRALRGDPPTERVGDLLPLLRDPVRIVRQAAAREFLSLPIARLPEPHAGALNAAMGEWRASLMNKADWPETHLALGGTALTMRNLPGAEAAFREAVRLDPQLVDAWIMLIRIRAATGDRAGAEAVLAEARAAADDPRLEGIARQFAQ